MHIPVLLNEVVSAFADFSARSSLNYFDGTFGRGGHYKAIKNRYNLTQAYACDNDLQAIQFCQENFPEVKISHQNFYEFAQQCNTQFDIMLLDLGISSPQVDAAERGFSFNKMGPLDMRMNQKLKLSAEDIINTYSEEQLISLFQVYGEVQRPHRVVKAIIQDRALSKIKTTMDLAGIIERIDGWKKKGFHPATQYFMALRLVVNQELEVLTEGLPLLINSLKESGRIAVITFHSLEDRLVKTIFNENQSGFMVNKKVIVPSDEECKNNKRARSAKLRIFQKGQRPEKPDKFALRRSLKV